MFGLRESIANFRLLPLLERCFYCSCSHLLHDHRRKFFVLKLLNHRETHHLLLRTYSIIIMAMFGMCGSNGLGITVHSFEEQIDNCSLSSSSSSSALRQMQGTAWHLSPTNTVRGSLHHHLSSVLGHSHFPLLHSHTITITTSSSCRR